MKLKKLNKFYLFQIVILLILIITVFFNYNTNQSLAPVEIDDDGESITNDRILEVIVENDKSYIYRKNNLEISLSAETIKYYFHQNRIIFNNIESTINQYLTNIKSNSVDYLILDNLLSFKDDIVFSSQKFGKLYTNNIEYNILQNKIYLDQGFTIFNGNSIFNGNILKIDLNNDYLTID